MKTYKSVPDEKPMPEESASPSLFEPFHEPQTIPAGWDVSEMLLPSWKPDNNNGNTPPNPDSL